ncbi:MAG: hypothetical protein NTV51_09515 [Verrucomicrobia bacterium]|nr:hypothetical protein [Verrucomicrobiota bacterium]
MTAVAHFSIRSQQAIGAALVEKFCFDYCISSPAVSVFVDQLWKVAIAKDLPAWETEGALIEITGRGDPLPEELVAQLGGEISAKLMLICDSATEISLSQMYGAYQPDESFRFLSRTAIATGVSLATFETAEVLRQHKPGPNGWGVAISLAELAQWQREVRRLCDPRR